MTETKHERYLRLKKEKQMKALKAAKKTDRGADWYHLFFQLAQETVLNRRYKQAWNF